MLARLFDRVGPPRRVMRAIATGACILAMLSLLAAACGSGGKQPETPDKPENSSSSAVVTPSPSSPTPTVDNEHPVGIIAIGHSGLTGEGTGGTYEAVYANSWATGSSPRVDSVYLRLVAVRPESEGHVANEAQGGAPASALLDQAGSALEVVPAPQLAIIQTVDDDIRCGGSNVGAVGEDVADVLAMIHEMSPNTKILVVGQLGRPSVAFVRKLISVEPSIKQELTWDDPCSFFDPDGNLRKSGFRMLTDVIDEYEAEIARVCEAVPNCATDDGVRRAYVDTLENFSPDYAHLNAKGQAAEAKLIWPVVKELLGL